MHHGLPIQPACLICGLEADQKTGVIVPFATQTIGPDRFDAADSLTVSGPSLNCWWAHLACFQQALARTKSRPKGPIA